MTTNNDNADRIKRMSENLFRAGDNISSIYQGGHSQMDSPTRPQQRLAVSNPSEPVPFSFGEKDKADLITPNVSMSTPSAKSGVEAYFNRDYNTAINHFRKAIMENPEKAKDYRTAINQALKEQKELGKYGMMGAQGSESQKLNAVVPQPPVTQNNSLQGLIPSFGFSKSAYAEELTPTEPVPFGAAGPSIEDKQQPLEYMPMDQQVTSTARPKTTPNEFMSFTAEQKGVQAYHAGDYQAALLAFKKAQQENPEKAELFEQAIDMILDEEEELRMRNMNEM